MSINDKKQNHQNGKRNQVNEQAANLAAIAQHQQQPKVDVVKQHVTEQVTEEQTNLNDNPQGEVEMKTETQAVRVQGETETHPELDQAIEAGLINQPSPELIAEMMAGQGEQPEVATNLQIIQEWVTALDKPTVTTLPTTNIHEITGEQIIAAFGLPVVIPTPVAMALISELNSHEQTQQFMPMVNMVVMSATTEEGLAIDKILDMGLVFVKPFVANNIVPMWDNIVKAVNSFIAVPVKEEAPTQVKKESIAERCKRIQAEADAKRAEEAKTSNGSLEVVKTTAVIATGETVSAVAMEHPEVVLKRDYKHLVGTTAYFDMRSSLYSKYHAWERSEQSKRLEA